MFTPKKILPSKGIRKLIVCINDCLQHTKQASATFTSKAYDNTTNTGHDAKSHEAKFHDAQAKNHDAQTKNHAAQTKSHAAQVKIHDAHAKSHANPNQSHYELFKFYSERQKNGYEYRQLRDSDYERFLSKRSSLREPALTRLITTLAYKVGKEFISLAEGMPNDEVFPFTRFSLRLRDGSELVMEGKQLANALQYLPTQGQPELLRELHKFQQDLHRPPNYEDRDVMITTGGQYGIYATIELLVNPGDPVLFNAHTYTGMHSVLKPYQPDVITVPEDENGTIPECLEQILTERFEQNKIMPKVMYLVPTGSNPSGTVISEERRYKIYDLACKFDFLIVEDDPYMFMNYSGKTVPSFLSLDHESRVIRIDSLSKVLAPGLRLGWVTAPRHLVQRMELHLQADHLHTSSLGQAVVNSLLTHWGRSGLATQLLSARALYLSRRDALHTALSTHVAGLASWTLPQAGMFFWLKLNVDDVYDMVFKTAFEKGLMLIPGHACTFDASLRSNYLRLAFSKVRVEDMDQAARLLADIIRDEQRRNGEMRLQGSATRQ